MEKIQIVLLPKRDENREKPKPPVPSGKYIRDASQKIPGSRRHC